MPKMVKDNKTLKYSIATGAIMLAVGGVASPLMFPHEVVKEVTVEKEVTKEVPVEKIVYVDKMVEVPVEVVKEVPVDNGKLDMVTQFLMDNNGDVEFITEDLDDDEAYKIAEYIGLSNEVKQFALDGVKEDLADEVDGKVVNGTTLDEDDVERIRLDNDSDEVEITDADFEDKDFTVKVTGRFEHEDVDYKFTADVKIRDGEYDEIDSVSVTLA